MNPRIPRRKTWCNQSTADLRDPQTTPLNFTKSINLAISERGIHALRHTGLPTLCDEVLSETTPMKGRMLHLKKNGRYVQEAQLYDAHGRNLLALDRTSLNTSLLDHLDTLPNVKFFFNYKLISADFRKKLAWFERHLPADDPIRGTEVERSFDFMIGADGAHSAVRYHLMKFTPMSYQQEYIDKLWCQFHVPASKNGDYRIPPNYLHIWPQDDSMFIALPNRDKTFTSTLFATRKGFETLDAGGPAAIVRYFHTKFPGVIPDLITEAELVRQYSENPHLPLITIKSTPYHFSSTGVILGDAAHAMVPFYGQGMNAGLEDVFVLFQLLDKYPQDRARALDIYSKMRTPDAHAINDLALRNYQEMASDVKKPLYLLRKKIEEGLDTWVPNLGWCTQYSRVTFSNMRYSEVIAASKRQASILNGVVGMGVFGAVCSAVFFVRGIGAHNIKMGVLRSICWVARNLDALIKGRD